MITNAASVDFADMSVTRVSIVPYTEVQGLRFYLLASNSISVLTTIGGGIEPSDFNLMDALLREVEEELGDYLTIHTKDILQSNAITLNGHICFLVHVDHIPPVFSPNDEISQVVWVTDAQLAILLRLHQTASENAISKKKYVALATTLEEVMINFAAAVNFASVVNYEANISQGFDRPPKREMTTEAFFDALVHHPEIFHGRLLVTADRENAYFATPSHDIVAVPLTKENIAFLRKHEPTRQRRSAYYVLGGDAVPGLITVSIREASRNPETKKFLEEAQKEYELSKRRMTPEERLKFFIDVEEKMYKIAKANEQRYPKDYEYVRGVVIDVIATVNQALLAGLRYWEIEEEISQWQLEFEFDPVAVFEEVVHQRFWGIDSQGELHF